MPSPASSPLPAARAAGANAVNTPAPIIAPSPSTTASRVPSPRANRERRAVMDATYRPPGYVFATMRTTRVVIASTVAGALAMLAACGQQVEAGGPGIERNTAVGNQPSSVELPRSQEHSDRARADADAVPPGQIDAEGLPDGHPVDVSVAPGGRTLTIVGQEGGCGTASAELTGQEEDRVAILLVETKPADENTLCTMDMRYPPLTVELDAPLKDRLVVLDHDRTRE